MRLQCSSLEYPRYIFVCQLPAMLTNYLISSDNELGCICPNPCVVSDPCMRYGTVNGTLNTCSYVQDLNSSISAVGPYKCGFHTCTCDTKGGWKLVVDSAGMQRCDPQDPCLNDPCSSNEDPLNECVPLYVPPLEVFDPSQVFGDIPGRRTYIPSGWMRNFITPFSFLCKCRGLGWTTPIGAQTCQMPDPCLMGDPCSSSQNPDNLCISGRYDNSKQASSKTMDTNVKDYFCECSGRGWFTPDSRQYCDRCPNPCLTNADACASNYDSANVCIWDLEGFLEAADELLNPIYDIYSNNPELTPSAYYTNSILNPQIPSRDSSNYFIDNYYVNDDGNPFNDYWSFLGPQLDFFGKDSSPLPAFNPREGRRGDGTTSVSKASVRLKASDFNFKDSEQPGRREAPLRRSYLDSTLGIGPRNVPAGQCGDYSCVCGGPTSQYSY
jgi:hypothetical protein